MSPEACDDDSQEMSWFNTTGHGEIFPDEEPVLGAEHVCRDKPVIVRFSEEDMAWAPVVSLVKMIPRLETLVYDCRSQFPPSLLDVLHGQHPQCKLHHLTFRLRSLLSDVPDPYEMRLDTSPCLYRAMMELIAGLAPKMKELVMVTLEPLRLSRSRLPQPRAPWRGLPGHVPGAGVGSLTSLSLVGEIHWSPSLLQTWAKHTDFSSLRQLTLGGGYTRVHEHRLDDGMMEWIVQNCSFPRLKALSVRLSRKDWFVERPKYAENSIAFFKAFEPLDELSVTGPLETGTLEIILSRHGPTLTRLVLRTEESLISMNRHRHRPDLPLLFGKEHILKIQAHCPALEDLSITIKRTKSDAIEAEIYKSFGKMDRLRSLFLTLDCSQRQATLDSSNNPSFDEEDNRRYSRQCGRLKKGHVRECFMNYAVDEMLARSIWDAICQHKLGTQVRSLKLWTTGGGGFGNGNGDYDIAEIVDNLSRAWLIERVVGEVINVRELGRRAREMRDQKVIAEHNKWPGASDTRALRTFRRVWPPKEGSKVWREDWSSVPLQA
ncbi:hypothetical protein F5883DRAFT_689352 [Diaporthe sp. PMI_573]|nr:hypothetical protein F5883DRAFT_689352 [Diaporthaceae sp. PMI_573]